MKKCTGCKKEKELRAFYKRDCGALIAKCMDCTRTICRIRHQVKAQKLREEKAKLTTGLYGVSL